MVSPLRVACRLTHGSYYEVSGTVKLWVPPQQSWGSPFLLAHRNISTAYINLGDYESALYHLNYISGLGWNVDRELAGALALAGRKKEAVSLFEYLISLESTSPAEKLMFAEEITALQSN